MSDQPDAKPTLDLPDPGKQVDDPDGEFSELQPDPAKGAEETDGNDADPDTYDPDVAEAGSDGE